MRVVSPLIGYPTIEQTWTGLTDTERILVTIDSSNGGSDTSETTVNMIESINEPQVTDYTNDNDVVDTDSLREAVANWRAGEINTELLQEVVNAWRSGDPVN